MTWCPRAGEARGLLRVSWLPAAMVLVVLLLASPWWGPHGDELYFRLPAQWWYEDQPPLTVWLSGLAAHASDQLWVQRIPAAVSASLGAVVGAWGAQTLGGSSRSQRLAAWSSAFTVYPLLIGHVFVTATLDLLAWQVVIVLSLRALRESPTWWVAVGAVAGVSCWNKLLALVLLAAVAIAAVLISPRALMNRWALSGAAAVGLIGGPQLLAQAVHGFPMSVVARTLAGEHAASVRLLVLPMLVVLVGPGLFAVWRTGLVQPWSRPGNEEMRLVSLVVIVMLVWTVVFPSQLYYPAGAALPGLWVGWVLLDRAWQQGAKPWRPRRTRARVVANGVASVMICLPVLPTSAVVTRLVSRVNPMVSDQLGWADTAQIVDLARGSETTVVTDSYPVAGAVDYYLRGKGVRVYSGHNALWSLGPPASQRVVLVGPIARTMTDWFVSCQPVSAPPAMSGRSPVMMAICDTPRRGWARTWPQFRRLG